MSYPSFLHPRALLYLVILRAIVKQLNFVTAQDVDHKCGFILIHMISCGASSLYQIMLCASGKFSVSDRT